MPTINVNWSKNAVAQIGPFQQQNFNNAREAAEDTANTVNTTATNPIASGFIRTSGRGTASFGFRRSYYGFDLSSYTTGTITNLALHYRPTTGSTGTLSNRLAQFTGFGTGVGSNYTASDWWDSIADPLVPYSNAFNSPDSSTAQEVTLLSQATTDAKADGFLKLVLMNITDYNGLNIAVDINAITNWNQSSNNTFLRFDYAAPGYGNTVNAIASANISQINAVATGNISQVIGVG